MKNLIHILCIIIAGTSSAFSLNHTINISGFTYSPDFLSMNIGDTVTINAVSAHPTAQVDKSTWEADGTTPMGTGWGVKTSTFTIVPTKTDTIYYVCQFHVSIGMKGRIAVLNGTGIFTSENQDANFQINPNPITSKGVLNLNLPEPTGVNIRIFDNYGRQVKNIKSDNSLIIGERQYEIDASDLESGVYFMIINIKDRDFFKKIVVIK